MYKTITFTTALAVLATLPASHAAADPAALIMEKHYMEVTDDQDGGLFTEATLTDPDTGKAVDFWSDGATVWWDGTAEGEQVNDIAPPYVFDPVTAEVNMDDAGTLEVIAFDADGKMDGALLASPQGDHIRIDASFGDGYIAFDLVVHEDSAHLRNIDMGLSPQVAEHRISTMFAFAATHFDDLNQLEPISRRGCMVRFGAISAICAGAIAVPSVWAPAVGFCTAALFDTYCQCLPLLGFDPCN